MRKPSNFDSYRNDPRKETLRPMLIDYVRKITRPDRKAGANMFVCPVCGSGNTGKRDSDGALHVTGNVWYCHSHNSGGDIFKLYAEVNGLDIETDFPDIINELSQDMGVIIPGSDRPISSAEEDFSPEGDMISEGESVPVKEEQRQKTRRDAQIYIFEGQMKGSPAETYLKERGFIDETISHFRLGYNPTRYVKKAEKSFESLVIPYPGTDYYTERLLNPDGADKYQNQPGGAPTFLIRESLKKNYFFVTEGQLDALSMYQVGARNIIASHYPSKIEDLIESGEVKIDGVVIVADNDEPKSDGTRPGEETAKKLTEIFSRHGIKSVAIYPPDGYKDANDLLRSNPDDLKALLVKGANDLTKAPEETSDGTKVFNVSEYLSENFFEKDIEYFKKYKDRKVGFQNVDPYLTLYPGVACLGGASSLGKTTFAVNIVDNLLERGESVIYFSLEQLPIELITKSLARRLYAIDPFSDIDNIGIKNGASSIALTRARSEYSQIAKNYQIVEGDFHFTVKRIIDYVERYIQKTGMKPVVVIDYLQLIAPPEGFKGTQREITDENLKAIKDLSKKNELFILLISSFNRASYKEPVGMESFKESGMIEYTCDYIFGLQLSLLEDSSFFTSRGVKGGERENNNDKKEKALFEAINKSPKEVELVALKNRNGRQRFKCFFKYEMKFDTFIPDMNSKYDINSPANLFKDIPENQSDDDLPFEDV